MTPYRRSVAPRPQPATRWTRRGGVALAAALVACVLGAVVPAWRSLRPHHRFAETLPSGIDRALRNRPIRCASGQFKRIFVVDDTLLIACDADTADPDVVPLQWDEVPGRHALLSWVDLRSRRLTRQTVLREPWRAQAMALRSNGDLAIAMGNPYGHVLIVNRDGVLRRSTGYVEGRIAAMAWVDDVLECVVNRADEEVLIYSLRFGSDTALTIVRTIVLPAEGRSWPLWQDNLRVLWALLEADRRPDGWHLRYAAPSGQQRGQDSLWQIWEIDEAGHHGVASSFWAWFAMGIEGPERVVTWAWRTPVRSAPVALQMPPRPQDEPGVYANELADGYPGPGWGSYQLTPSRVTFLRTQVTGTPPPGQRDQVVSPYGSLPETTWTLIGGRWLTARERDGATYVAAWRGVAGPAIGGPELAGAAIYPAIDGYWLVTDDWRVAHLDGQLRRTDAPSRGARWARWCSPRRRGVFAPCGPSVSALVAALVVALAIVVRVLAPRRQRRAGWPGVALAIAACAVAIATSVRLWTQLRGL